MDRDREGNDGAGKKGFSVVDRRALAEDDGESSDTQTSADKPSYVRQLERALEDRDRKLREIASTHQSSLADLEEARIRIRREVYRELEQSRRSMIVEFLDVMDNLDRAIEAAGQTRDLDVLMEGVALVRDLFVSKLEGLGVSRVETLGSRFDPAVHEALTMVPVEDPSIDGTVVGVIRDGYVIGDEVLRPAAVAVGKSPTST